MADILSLSVSGKGLFTFNNVDQLALQSSQPFAAEVAENPAAAPAGQGGSGEQSGTFASFASLFDSQLGDQQAGRVGVLPREFDVQQASPSLFFSGEPLTSTPLGKFQLSSIDGDGLPGAGMRSPESGNSLPVPAPGPGLQILDPAQPEAVIPGNEAVLTLSDVSFTVDAGHSPLLPVEDSAGPGAGMAVAQTETITAHPAQETTAQSSGDIFDDLAFLPEKGVSRGDAMADQVAEAAKTVIATPQQLAAAAGQGSATDVETAADMAGVKADELIAGKTVPTGIDEAAWHQQGRVAGGGEASAASRHPESLAGRTERSGPESSRQQFAEQLAQSALAEGDSPNKIGTVREQLAQLTGQAPASAASQSASEGAPDAQQVTRMDSAMTGAEQAKPGAAENKSVDIRLAVPFSRKDWSEQLGKQLGFLVSRNMDSAQIQLDPPELGPLQVRIQLHQDQVSLQFHAQHGIVREAVDQSLVRLQELFSEEGLELVSVDVSDGETNRGSTGEKQEPGNSLATGQGGESDEILTPVVSQLNIDGKIDYFI